MPGGLFNAVHIPKGKPEHLMDFRIIRIFFRCYEKVIGRLLKSLGWSWQKPTKRALERDEKKIEKWKEEDWPRIKKTPKTWAPT